MSDGGVEKVLVRDLERFVKDEAFMWGDNVEKSYFELAKPHMNSQWEFVQNFLGPYPIDYTSTMELSCGRDRNSERLANLAKDMTLVDVNPESISFCKKSFSR